MARTALVGIGRAGEAADRSHGNRSRQHGGQVESEQVCEHRHSPSGNRGFFDNWKPGMVLSHGMGLASRAGRSGKATSRAADHCSPGHTPREPQDKGIHRARTFGAQHPLSGIESELPSAKRDAVFRSRGALRQNLKGPAMTVERMGFDGARRRRAYGRGQIADVAAFGTGCWRR